MYYLEQLTLVASAISLRHDIHDLCSIGVQRKPPWSRMNDDEYSVCRGTVVLPATRADGHAACRMACRRPSAEWTRHIKC
jgi:hypothetical protein